MSKHQKRLLLTAAATGAMAFALSGQAARADLVFTPGDLVVSVEGDGSGTGSYGDNEAAPLTLYEFTTTGMNQTPVGSLELPQTMSGSQFPVSGEYGSSSEATLQLSGNGKYLAIAGYGVNANAFNADPAAFGPDPTNTALGQSGSLTGKSDTPVPRVAALINIDGSISSSTALSNIFDQNNPRSVYTVDGTSFYVSGQGNYPDSTGGVFYATLGSHSATSITGNDAGGGTSQDTRTVLVYNNTLYVSSDSKKGSTNRDYIGTLSPAGGPLPTSVANSGNGPAMLPGFGNSGGTGKVTISKVGGVSNGNTVNAVGDQINLSPSNFFFANADTLYVADTGSPKNTSATSPLGDGGLQKWSFKSGSWTSRLYTVRWPEPRPQQRCVWLHRSLRPDGRGRGRRFGGRAVRHQLYDHGYRPGSTASPTCSPTRATPETKTSANSRWRPQTATSRAFPSRRPPSE